MPNKKRLSKTPVLLIMKFQTMPALLIMKSLPLMLHLLIVKSHLLNLLRVKSLQWMMNHPKFRKILSSHKKEQKNKIHNCSKQKRSNRSPNCSIKTMKILKGRSPGATWTHVWTTTKKGLTSPTKPILWIFSSENPGMQITIQAHFIFLSLNGKSSALECTATGK